MAMIAAREVVPDPVGASLQIGWADGLRSSIPYATLRDRCPCARCREEREKGRRALRMAMSLKLLGWSRVGNYALNFEWGDSHHDGIFTYAYLRELVAPA